MIDVPLELRLLAHGRARLPSRLDTPWTDLTLPLPALEDLVALADGRRVVVWGGEPTLRSDLPHLLAALNAPILRTDGLGLTKRPLVAHLARCGLAGVRLPLHSGRRDANDWLMDRPGATRAVVAAARSAAAEGLRLEIEITLTRPTASHLSETVELAARLGAAAVHIRRLVRRGPADPAWVVLSPRIGLMEPWLQDAVRVGRRAGLDVSLHDLPPCSAPELPAAVFAPAPEWLTVSGDAWEAARIALLPVPDDARCATCPGTPACDGPPKDYASLFGSAEFRSERSATPAQAAPLIPPGVEAPTMPPPPRHGRPPATRLRAIHEQLDRGDLHGDPITPRGQAPSQTTTVAWAVDEPTRAVRIRLVRASQQGSATLRIEGGAGLRHPSAATLLREATRLSIDDLELHGDLSGLAAMTDDELRRLRRFSRATAQLFGATAEAHDASLAHPGAFEETVAALDRLHRATRRRVDIAFSGPDWQGGDLPWPNRA